MLLQGGKTEEIKEKRRPDVNTKGKTCYRRKKEFEEEKDRMLIRRVKRAIARRKKKKKKKAGCEYEG